MDPSPWRIGGVDLRAARHLSAELGVGRVLAEVLVRRGFTDPEAAKAFLSPSFRLRDPFRLAGMDAARRRVDRALQHGEAIVVHGDYDADGITGTFVLASALKELGADVSSRLPSRFAEGYGLSTAAVEEAAAGGAGLLLTVDCGIRDVAAVRRAAELGLDVVVTDHHAPGPELPDCVIVSPMLGDYPFPHLAGVGVAFKLAHALFERPQEPWAEVPLALRKYLDAVAVGTVADVVPLLDENRVLVMMGLARLQTAPNLGLAALLEVAGGPAGTVDAGALAFRVGPRLNAAGRLDDASLALDLLTAEDRGSALRIAHKLDECNAERRQLEQSMLQQALAMVPDPPPAGVVLADLGWHEGVVGIVANRVAEQVRRPAILLCSGDEVAKGSGRSIPGFDLLAAVTASAGPLLGFGGHAAACGLRLRRDDIPHFRDLFVEQVAARLDVDLLEQRLDVDAVAAGDELTLPLAEELAALAPHGVGNPRVTLLVHGAQVEAPRRSRDGRHLRCRVRVDGVCASAVHFDFQGTHAFETARFDVPLELVTDHFNGGVSAQAKVRALMPLVAPQDDLCATHCDGGCPDRLSADDLRQAVVDWPLEGPDDWQARLGEVREDGRLDDRRGRPVISTLTGVLAAGGRTLVLVADVGRRRPLLTRDLPLAALDRQAAYVHDACAAGRLRDLLEGAPPSPAAPAAAPAAAGPGMAPAAAAPGAAPSVIMATAETAAAYPRLAAAADRVVFVDPPLSGPTFAGVLAALAPHADVHLLWGEAEIGFAGKVLGGHYDLDRRLRSLWRTLGRNGGALGLSLDEEMCSGTFLGAAPTLAAALRVLGELGLLVEAGGKNPDGKVDLAASRTYGLWHQRYRNERFLDHCRLTAL
jgi:single-stranded-DNA-specific exonuclease